jgi:hypothetical protein
MKNNILKQLEDYWFSSNSHELTMGPTTVKFVPLNQQRVDIEFYDYTQSKLPLEIQNLHIEEAREKWRHLASCGFKKV